MDKFLIDHSFPGRIVDIGNERYGLSVVERDRLDEADVRMAFEYKNYKKGVRQVYMLIPKLSGRKIGIDRVRRIMREYGMNSCVRQANVSRQAASKRLAKYCKPNLLQRMFRLHRPNEVRLTDVTYLMYNDESVAYGSALMDPVTGVLIAFVVSANNDVSLATETLRAMDDHPCKDGGIIHSDQGSVYLSDEFQREVENLGIRQSMSKRGNCWDNAPMESFFGRMKERIMNLIAMCQDFETAQRLIAGYMDAYNNVAYQYNLAGLTPTEFYQYTQTGIYPLVEYFGVKASELGTQKQLIDARINAARKRNAAEREAYRIRREREQRIISSTPSDVIVQDQIMLQKKLSTQERIKERTDEKITFIKSIMKKTQAAAEFIRDATKEVLNDLRNPLNWKKYPALDYVYDMNGMY